MPAFHSVSFVREVVAAAGCVVRTCSRKKGSEVTEENKRKRGPDLAYSVCLWFQLVGLQSNFPIL